MRERTLTENDLVAILNCLLSWINELDRIGESLFVNTPFASLEYKKPMRILRLILASQRFGDETAFSRLHRRSDRSDRWKVRTIKSELSYASLVLHELGATYPEVVRALNELLDSHRFGSMKIEIGHVSYGILRYAGSKWPLEMVRVHAEEIKRERLSGGDLPREGDDRKKCIATLAKELCSKVIDFFELSWLPRGN